MKHLLLPFLLLALSAGAQLPYSLEVLDQPYAPLEDAAPLEFDMYDYEEGWDDPEFMVDLGFEVDLDGISFEQVFQIGTGTILFSNSNPFAGFIPISYDLADIGFSNPKTPSLIRWETTGEPGNQVFALEWANAGFYEEVFGGGGLENPSFVNVQMRIFEATGIIEYHYGSSFIGPAITEPTWAALVLSFDYDYYNGSFLMPIGDPANPTLELVTDFYDLYYEEFLTGYAADGAVYRFTPTGETLGMEAAAQPEVKAWPNPTSGLVQVVFNGQHDWALTDAVGREVLNGTGQDGARLDLDALEVGAYLFRLDNGQVERIVRH